jgi:hypothetical protein
VMCFFLGYNCVWLVCICRTKQAFIIYLRVSLPMVSHGGQEKNSSRQIWDHRLEALVLEKSMHYGIKLE